MLIQINKFSGEVPRLPGHALPEGFAQYARNCVFSHGELRQMDADVELTSEGTRATTTIADLYTEDGLTFFVWHNKAYPQRCPVPNDQHNRVYYIGGNKVRVTNQDPRAQAYTPTSFKTVGVPTPESFFVGKNTNPNGYPDNVTSLKHTFFWEAGSNRYQEIEFPSVSSADNGKTYTYLKNKIPDKEYNIVTSEDADGKETTDIEWVTPSNAVPVIMIEGFDADGDLVFVVYGGDTYRANEVRKLSGAVTLKMDVNNPTYGVVLVPGDDAAYTDALIDADLQIKLSWSEDDTRAYVVTAVNLWGEESAPTDPIIERFTALDTPVIQNIKMPDGYTEYHSIWAYRIYRTATGSSGTQFFFVAEVAPNTSLIDEIKDEALGEELPSENWYTSPGGVSILELMPNGIFAASSGNTLHFSHPYLPHAWNPLDAIAFEKDIVAMKAHESGLVVITRSGPYLISGVAPDSMTMTKMNVPHTALNSRAITKAGRGIIYASHDGLVMIGGATGSIEASVRLWTRKDWHKMTWDSRRVLRLAAHDGKVVIHDLHYGGGHAETDSYIIDIDESSGQLSRCEALGRASFVLPLTDGLYFGRGNQIHEFQGNPDSVRSFIWSSKRYILPKPVNFSVIEVDCDNAVAIKVYSQRGLDKNNLTAQVISATEGNNRYRLVSGFRSRVWEIEVTSSDPINQTIIRSITLANSRMELGRV